MKLRLFNTTLSYSPFASALVLLSGLAMSLLTQSSAQAQSRSQVCGLQSLTGSYVFATHGYNIVSGAAVPKAILEGIDFNGDGTLTSPFSTISINGVILRFANTTGTYTVAEDCTGTVSFTGGASFDIFVGQKAKEISMIQTGPAEAPAVFEGVARKVSN